MDWEVSSLACFKVLSQHLVSFHTSKRIRLLLYLLMCQLTLDLLTSPWIA